MWLCRYNKMYTICNKLNVIDIKLILCYVILYNSVILLVFSKQQFFSDAKRIYILHVYIYYKHKFV